MIDAPVAAVAVQHLPTGHTVPGLGAVPRVIDAGVDHLGIARARLRADRIRLVDHHYVPPAQRQAPRDRQADHTCADDQAIDGHGHCVSLTHPYRAGDTVRPGRRSRTLVSKYRMVIRYEHE